jgi:hypothetical protein
MNKFVILWILQTALAIFGTIMGYRTGYNKGADKVPEAVSIGWNAALDSIQIMLKQQARADTNHCTYLCIDTTKYFLQHKKICY